MQDAFVLTPQAAWFTQRSWLIGIVAKASSCTGCCGKRCPRSIVSCVLGLVQEADIEHIRRQMALLQQQTHLSTEQLKQQVAWLRQQMHGLAAQISTLVQDQAEQGASWELNALQVRSAQRGGPLSSLGYQTF